MYVCLCKAITESDIFEAIDEGARTPKDLAERLGAGTQCTACLDYMQELLTEAHRDGNKDDDSVLRFPALSLA